MAQDPKPFWEFTIGNVIAWTGLAATGLGVWFKMRFTQEAMAKQLETINQDMQKGLELRERNAVVLVTLTEQVAAYHRRLHVLEELVQTMQGVMVDFASIRTDIEWIKENIRHNHRK